MTAPRPADARIDDLAAPPFPPEIAPLLTAMAAMGAPVRLESIGAYW